MDAQEIEIKNYSELPEILYHLVPEKLFEKFIDDAGNYDCRYKDDWGKNSPFIHTTPTKKQLKERVADLNWSGYPLEEKFVLLEIDPKKVISKFTYAIVSGYVYHHIWESLPKNSFKIEKIERDNKGKFLI